MTFSNVTETNLPEISKKPRNSMDAKVTDFNGDGKPDIFIGCFRASDILPIQN
ncbi:MAG: FG-GAP repeat protein [Allomuricauda sp.]